MCIIIRMSLAQEIKDKAIELGFDLAGITDASPIDTGQVEFFNAWLKSGFAGQMDSMHRNPDKRFNPAALLEDARSVIVVGLNFNPPKQQSDLPDPNEPTGKVAPYARYEDYHTFIKEKLIEIADFITSVAKQDVRFKICVDSVPLAERALAVRAGLGFIGKNHMLINPEFGCQIFLGEIITNLKLETDVPIAADCSNCHKCVDACPTGALKADGRFDTSRCINYLTIEHKGPIPTELAVKIGDKLFGCDECILVCPYQKDAPTYRNKQFKFYSDRARIGLREILDLSRESFDAVFSDSVIKRLGLDRLKRNAKICLTNIKQNRKGKSTRNKKTKTP